MRIAFSLSRLLLIGSLIGLIGATAAHAQQTPGQQQPNIFGPINLPQDTLAADSYTSYQEGQTLLATPAADKNAVMQISQGLEKLGAAGHLVVLDAGTRVQATGSGPQVRVLVGPHSGQIWYLISDADVRKPKDIPPGGQEVQ
ncbi:MAG TPA: hypothetical protein VKV28_03060 [Candidatus Binataceae bacterium]|nr:hypothetical protein [Candidatus Binataceae bacterium]